MRDWVSITLPEGLVVKDFYYFDASAQHNSESIPFLLSCAVSRELVDNSDCANYMETFL